MTQYFPIIVEQESNGTVSAWVAGPSRAKAASSRSNGRKGGRPPRGATG